MKADNDVNYVRLPPKDIYVEGGTGPNATNINEQVYAAGTPI